MFCPKCGKNVADGSKFCDGCGTSIIEHTTPAYAPTFSQSQQEYYHPTSFSQKPQASNDETLSIGNYIAMMLITLVPIVGFIILLVWSFGGNSNQNKKNWARAMLIIGVILFAVMFLFSSLMGSMITRLY